MGSAEPFDLDGDDDVGVVLVHGFTGTPYEVGYLGRSLAKNGFVAPEAYASKEGDDYDEVTAKVYPLYQEALRAKYPEIDWTVKVGASEGNSIDHWSTDEEREQAEELLDSIGVAGVDPDWQETLDRAVREVTRV